MENELEILRIVKEDVLRILAENNNRISEEFIDNDIKVSKYFMDKAFNELKKDGLITQSGQFFELTGDGIIKSRYFLEKHIFLEKYFKDLKDKKEVDRISHIIEHHISEEVIENIKKLSTFKKEGLPLTKFNKEECFITDINSDDKFFERLVSMGILPGEKIKIINVLPNGLIFKIKNKKIFLAREIANKVRVIAYEES